MTMVEEPELDALQRAALRSAAMGTKPEDIDYSKWQPPQVIPPVGSRRRHPDLTEKLERKAAWQAEQDQLAEAEAEEDEDLHKLLDIARVARKRTPFQQIMDSRGQVSKADEARAAFSRFVLEVMAEEGIYAHTKERFKEWRLRQDPKPPTYNVIRKWVCTSAGLSWIEAVAVEIAAPQRQTTPRPHLDHS